MGWLTNAKERRSSKEVRIGDVWIGGNHPIAIQSMTNTKTENVEETVKQILALEKMGCEIIRCAVPTMEAAKALKEIKKQISIPLVADIHFDYRLAIASMEYGADKVRINPGNIGSKEKIKAVVDVAKEREIPLRVGVNSGSLEKHLIENEIEYIPIDENHPQAPINPYGKSKFMIEQIMDDYDKAYGLKSIKLRYFNVIGADKQFRIGEWHEPETHLIPNILKSVFNANITFEIYGDDYSTKDGTCCRDYVDVEDLVQAHLLALKYLKTEGRSNYFNLGTKTGNTVLEVFNECEKLLKANLNKNVLPRREGDPVSLVADNSKAKKLLKWSPKKVLEDSIKSAYNWERVLVEES